MDRDEELMTRARFGDERAFAEIVNRHKDAVVNYLTRLTGERCDAEDLAQETFLKLFASSQRYRNQGKFKGFLMRMATNTALSHLRKAKRQRVLFGLFTAESTVHSATASHTPQSRLLDTEAQRVLTEAIASLPWRFRVPLVLREIEALPYEAISEIVGCSRGTVKSRISRGRGRLKKRLAPYLDGVMS